MSLPLIAIWNKSPSIPDADLPPVVAALQRQVSEHLAPIWGTDAKLVAVASTDTPPAGAWVISLVELCDDAGALGYHTDEFVPSGQVGIKSCRDDGVSWQSCLSHEVLEMVVDPYATLCFEAAGKVSEAWVYSTEVCDPVESSTYQIDGVEVSDFVFPDWFEDQAAGPWDYLKVLTAAHSLARGGYFSRATLTNWEQKNAELTRESKKIAGVGSRRARRFNR